MRNYSKSFIKILVLSSLVLSSLVPFSNALATDHLTVTNDNSGWTRIVNGDTWVLTICTNERKSVNKGKITVKQGNKVKTVKAKKSKVRKSDTCTSSSPYLISYTFTEIKKGNKTYRWSAPGHSITFKIKVVADLKPTPTAPAIAPAPAPAPAPAIAPAPAPAIAPAPAPAPAFRFPYSSRIQSLNSGISNGINNALVSSLARGDIACGVRMSDLSSYPFGSLQESYQSGSMSEGSAVAILESAWRLIIPCSY